MNKILRIIFMGTPDFAVPSLDALVNNNYDIAAVVTSPDKPAGRGQQMRQSPVKQYAASKGIKVLQPVNLKDALFIKELSELNADLQVVVAFRMLPEALWNMPELGTFNLHASLLPQYRGAAPINRAVISGEKETGVTTFFITHNIDAGAVIFREKVFIGAEETAGELHSRLMLAGAELVLKTVKSIETADYSTIEQTSLYKKGDMLKLAPKIFKDDCKIDWSKNIDDIFNLIRGLSPYPAAWTELVSTDGDVYSFKIYRCKMQKIEHSEKSGKISTNHKTELAVAVKGGYIYILDLQLSGKKKMGVEEFLRGFQIPKLSCFKVF